MGPPGCDASFNDCHEILITAMSTERAIQTYLDEAGIELDAERFVRLVSNLYHEAESQYYDHVHSELEDAAVVWRQSLNAISSRLPDRVRILDVGAGTGFASDIVLEFLGRRADHLVCLDPSAAMLQKARLRLSRHACPTQFVAGDLSSIAGGSGKFDLVLTNSVLHHIPDVDGFIRGLRRLLAPGGIYIAGHEPSRDFYAPGALYRWTQLYRRWRNVRRLFLAETYRRRLTSAPAARPPEATVNEILLRRNVIKHALRPEIIRQLIDIHVPPAHSVDTSWGQQGLRSNEILTRNLTGFTCCFVRTYSHVKEARQRMGFVFRAIDGYLAKRYPAGGSNFLMAAQCPGSHQPPTPSHNLISEA